MIKVGRQLKGERGSMEVWWCSAFLSTELSQNLKTLNKTWKSIWKNRILFGCCLCSQRKLKGVPGVFSPFCRFHANQIYPTFCIVASFLFAMFYLYCLNRFQYKISLFIVKSNNFNFFGQSNKHKFMENNTIFSGK